MDSSHDRSRRPRFYPAALHWTVFAILTFSASTAWSGDCIDYGQFLRWVGGADTPGSPYGVAVLGSYAYIGDGSTGLQILDISDPRSPELVGGVDTPGFAYAVVVAGAHAYVADGNAGLQVVDISNPAAPAIVGSVDTPGEAGSVAVGGAQVYVADGAGGLLVADVSNPASPAIVGSVPAIDAKDVAVKGPYAYVTDNTTLRVIDISSPVSPSIVATVNVNAHSVAIDGIHAYLSGGSSESLTIVDISIPTSPVVRGSVEVAVAEDVAAGGNYAYVVGPHGLDWPGLQVIDVSTPAAPSVVGSFGIYAWNVAISGDHAYIAGLSLEVIDISHPLNPAAIGGLGGGGDTRALAVFDSLACAIDVDRLVMADISDPSSPMALGSLILSTPPVAVALSETHAYVVGPTGLEVVDVTDPSLPVIVGSCPTPGQPHDVAVNGGHAFIADGASGLQVVDVSNPQLPAVVGGVATQGTASGVAAAGTFAYVAGSIFEVVDVSIPAHPVIVGGADAGGIAVAVAGTHAYVAGGDLKIVDISSPVAPAMVGSLRTPDYANDIAVAGSHVYIADFVCGLQVVNVADPTSPSIEGGVTLGFPYVSSRAVAVDGGHAYISEVISGQPAEVIEIRSAGSAPSSIDRALGRVFFFEVFPFQCSLPVNVDQPSGAAPTRPRLSSSSPNPMSPAAPTTEISFELPERSAATLRIFDASGRLERTLLDGTVDAGVHRVRWDGRNDAGKAVGSGVYFYRLDAGDFSESRALVRVR